MSPWSRFLSAAALACLFVRALWPGASPGADLDIDGWIRASREEFGAGRWERALEPTRALVDHFPSQQVYSDRLARIYHELGQPVEEAAAWEQFIRSASTPQDACPALGEAYLRAGRGDASLNAFERCRDFDTASAEAWFYLGQAYRRDGRIDDAIRTFEGALRVDPQHADSRVGLASTRLRLGDPAAALEAIAPAVAHDRTNPDVHLMLGLALLQLGRSADARTALDRALAITDTYVDVHMAMGMVEYAEGRPAAAHGRFARALALSPTRRGEIEPWLQRTQEPLR